MDDRLRQLLQLAREHYAKNEYDKAEPLLQRILHEGSGFADCYNMLGVIHHLNGNFSDAEKMFEEALRINPRYTEAALNLAVTYNDVGKYQLARDVYSRISSFAKDPSNNIDSYAKGKLANMHADVADAYLELGLLADAAREYKKALDLCPSFVDIRTRYANTLRDLGDRDQAVSEYQSVKAQAPKYHPGRINLGVTLYMLGKKAEAKAEWEAVLADDPTNKSCRMYLDILK